MVCFCGYFCNYSMRWRSEDFDSYKWVQALKGKTLNKHAYVSVRGAVLGLKVHGKETVDAMPRVTQHVRARKVMKFAGVYHE